MQHFWYGPSGVPTLKNDPLHGAGFVLLAVVILLSPLLAPIGAHSSTTPTGIAASLFSTNVYLYRDVGTYFAPATTLNPLLHTWWLSVEEQFYFVMPLLVRSKGGRFTFADCGYCRAGCPRWRRRAR